MEKPIENIKLRPKWQDIFVIIVPLFAAAFVFFLFFGNSFLGKTDRKYATITVNSEVVASMDLSVEDTLELSLPYNNIIVVHEGKIGISSASCPDKTCVHSGQISEPGQIIVCVPSKLIITISGDDSAGAADALTR